jgi:hypothetical protein
LEKGTVYIGTLIVLFAVFARWVLFRLPATRSQSSPRRPARFSLLGLESVHTAVDGRLSRAPWLPARPMEGKRSGRSANLHPFFQLMLFLVLFRVFVFVLAYVIQLAQNGYSGGLFESFGLWNQLGTDSQHYLTIARDGYVNLGDDRLLIVFLPLYPILVKIFNYVFGSYLASGLFVSNVCWLLAAYMLYELALLDTNRRGALRALKYLCILPASFLFASRCRTACFCCLAALRILRAKRALSVRGHCGLFRLVYADARHSAAGARHLRACRPNYSRTPRARRRRPLEAAHGWQRAFASAHPLRAAGISLRQLLRHR